MNTAVFTRTALLLLFWVGMIPLYAQQITQEMAKEKAFTFFHQTNNLRSQARGAQYKQPLLSLANNQEEFYVFNDKANGGWVVISGDERMPDVLSYSYDGQYDVDNLPCNMEAWMDDYVKQVKYLRAHPESRVTRGTTPERENISPMLTCWFSQGAPYNNQCPIHCGQHCVTGCVATAIAQVMYYYQWPKQTTEVIHGYTTCGFEIELPDMPITTIDWDNILDKYSDVNYSDKQVDAISTLMLLCGMAIGMNYTTTASCAFIDAPIYAFRKYFDYEDHIELIKRSYYNTDVWEQIIYDELKNGRPVIYGGDPEKGDGHAMVIDGYKDGYFHINWGWGGYETYALMTGVEGWNGYMSDQYAIVDIQPATGEYPSRYATLDNGRMTLYYDKEKTNRSGIVLPHMDKWQDHAEEVTECVIDPSFANLRPKDLKWLFYHWGKMESITGLENLNTSLTYNMECMFEGCSSLKSLDVSGFITDNVQLMGGLFAKCSGLESLDVSGFKTDNATEMIGMFSGCSGLSYLDVSGFKTDIVTDMRVMFQGCSALTNLDVSGFKTANVTDMGSMFEGCSSLKSLDVSGFNTENVTSMWGMFSGCSALTSLDVSGFKTENVTDMTGMFGSCSGLTSLDVSGFKTDNVKIMTGMFSGCSGLPYLDVSGFKTDNVTNIAQMFYDCSSLTNLDVSGFNTENVTNMRGMFMGCSALSSLDVSGFNTENVTNMYSMFSRCFGIKNLDVSYFKTDIVTDMGYMFSDCSSLTKLDVSGFKTENVTNMRSLFYHCSGLTNLDVSGFKTDNVTDMSSMFDGCSGLKDIDVRGFKTDKVDNMGFMFCGCSRLTNLDVGSFNTEKVTNMLAMFCACSGLTSLDVSGFKTDNVENMDSMFDRCSGLSSLDLHSFNTENVSSMRQLFYGCSSLTTIYVSDKWNVDKVECSDYIFIDCFQLVGGMGTKYSEDGIEYAHIDGGTGNPGYLTKKEFVELTMSNTGKTTYSGNKPLDFRFANDLKAYVATGYESDGTIWLTRVKQVPANTPIFIKGEADETYEVPVMDKCVAHFENMFKGSADEDIIISTTTEDGKYKNFYMSGGQFKPASASQKISAGKAYLQVPATFNAAVAGEDQTVKIADSGKSSYAPPVDIDVTDVEGLKAYAATGYDAASSTIWLTRINKIQAGEGVMLKGEAGKEYTLPSAEVQAYYGNMFVGNIDEKITINETSDDGEWTNYYLASGSFKKVSGTREIGTNKSYLHLPTSLLVSSARGKNTAGIDEWFMEELETETILLGSIGGDDEDGTTRIDAITNDNAQPDIYYNLQGQRINNPKKGLYIKRSPSGRLQGKNGKKIFVR